MTLTNEDLQAICTLFDHRFNDIDNRFESIDQKFERIDQRFEIIDKRFNKLEEDMDRKFKVVVEQLSNIFDEKIARVETRLDQHDIILKSHDIHINKIMKKLEIS